MNSPVLRPRTALELFRRTLVLAIVIAFCTWWSITYTNGALGLSYLWIGSGVLCGVLLISPRVEWPAYLLGGFAAHFSINILLNGLGPISVVFSFADTLEAWIVAAIVTSRFNDATDLTHIKSSVVVGAWSALLACGVSGLMASAASMVFAPTLVPFMVIFWTWVISHALGLGIFATLTIAVCVERPGLRWQRLELVVTLGLLAVACWLIFAQSRFAVTFLLFPALMLCAFRHRFSGFSSAVGLVAIIATMQTAAGHGPFMMGTDVSDVQRVLMLHAFITNATLLTFFIASVLIERKLLMRRLAKSEHEYRLLADNSSDLVSHIAAGNVRRYISPSVVEILGWTREEFSQPRFDLVHAEDIDAVMQEFDEVTRTGEAAIVQCRMQHKGGHYVWMELNVRTMPGKREGELPGIVFAGRDVSQRREDMLALERLARHDVLTGLGNRLNFNERLELAVARSRCHRKPLALLYLDIDHFKGINDTHGHAVGDAVLCEFAARLQSSIRATDFAARLGGDEFVMLLDDIDALDGQTGSQVIAEKLIANLIKPIVVGEQHLRVTASIGIAQGVVVHKDPEDLLRVADAALYEAKVAGRNTWRIQKLS